MMGLARRVAGFGLLAAMALGLGACGGAKMWRGDVEVRPDSALVKQAGGAPTIRVDLVGVNDVDLGAWQAKPMSEYWEPGDPLRASAEFKHTMTFAEGRTAPQTLTKKDPIWNEWKSRGAMHLLVLADLPGAHQDLPGDTDDRRVVLPLDSSRWEANQAIKILLQRAGVRCETPPKPVGQ
jgi:hypothetical protein